MRLCLASLGLCLMMGCGSTADNTGDEPDAADVVLCDPVEQTGCEGNEKCSALFNAGANSIVTACVAAGAVGEGGACTEIVDAATGVDDCAPGYFCLNSKCTTICNTAGGCGNQATCTRFNGVFDEYASLGVGMCQPLCDVFDQGTCADPGEGCYVSLGTELEICIPVEPIDGTGVQGDDCAFNNNCAIGYGCTLIDPVDAAARLCAFYCDASGGGGPACADGPGVNYTCLSITAFYGDVDIDPKYGMCADCALYPGAPGCT
jgi:hypothetical protein